ncbi:MAG: histidinol-phosphatase HisJ family protein [Clostridiales Family XIII bacterium]|jgi:histidinol-phosphatase (PHP family)|nr:histidinol-phosphatase HisJ family protein [Clostridiales Family XIII bacterium]
MYDYHTHTVFSGDATGSIDDAVEAAIRAGLDEIAVTDHFDPEYSDTSWYEDPDISSYTYALKAVAAKHANSIKVIRGIEAGMQPGRANRRLAEAIDSYGFDFVLGSVHSAGGLAIDTPPYLETRDARAAVRDYYMAMIDCIREFDDFDVLGHFNVIDRYIDEIPEDEVFWDLADEALRLIVSMGKGLEVNTRSWQIWEGRHATPTLRILKRYVELGGETVTTGSDAHSADAVGQYLKEGEDFIRTAGLRYLATFRNRKVFYVKL